MSSQFQEIRRPEMLRVRAVLQLFGRWPSRTSFAEYFPIATDAECQCLDDADAAYRRRVVEKIAVLEVLFGSKNGLWEQFSIPLLFSFLFWKLGVKFPLLIPHVLEGKPVARLCVRGFDLDLKSSIMARVVS